MKQSFLVFLVLISTGGMSWAQKSTTAVDRMSDRDLASSGVRVSFIKPSLDWLRSSETQLVERPYTNAMAISIGYAHMPINELGWTTNLAYHQLQEGFVTNGLLRVDGNLGTAFNKNFTLKAGLNVSKFVSGKEMSQLKPGIGSQISAGYQFIRSFGIDVAYVEMNQSGVVVNEATLETRNLNVRELGAEVSLHGTF